MSSDLVAHCIELLAPLGAVRARRMFGAWGLYLDDLFFAVIAFERLYLKTDALTQAQFEAAGGEPFRVEMKGRPMTMAYWTVPAEAMDSPALMQPWARQAVAAALRARAAKPAAVPSKARSTRPSAAAAKSRRKT
jgi:DNA transformation protein and related proteins